MTSFQKDIRPLFTERDIHAMSKAFNLASYDDVRAHAAAIYDRIRGIGGAVMPPPRREARVRGLKIALNYSRSGWPMDTSSRSKDWLKPKFSLFVGSTSFLPTGRGEWSRR
jgi:hypothetical protein